MQQPFLPDLKTCRFLHASFYCIRLTLLTLTLPAEFIQTVDSNVELKYWTANSNVIKTVFCLLV